MRLREFQIEAIDRLRRGNLYLAAKPGAGKTAVAVHAAYEAIKDRFSTGRVLVVTPKRVVPHFEAEAARWGVDLTFSYCIGDEAQRIAAIDAPTDVLVVSRDHFPWLIKRLVRKRLYKQWMFGMIIYDEASRLRNGGRQGSVSWKLMKAISQKYDPQFLLMSGSPRPGTAHELFAPVMLLDGGKRLGTTLGDFRVAYMEPYKFDRNSGRVFSWRLRAGMEEALYGKIADLFYVADPDLGLKYVEIDRHIVLSAQTMDQINDMARHLTADVLDDEITAASFGVASMKVQQMCSGEVFNDDGGTTIVHSEKVDDLRELIEEMDGEPLMVGYWYTHELDRLKREFPQAVDISTEQGLADALAGKVQLALIHPQSAGHGIDGLQSHFSAFYWYTLPHSYEYYDQAIKRIVRSGQKESVRVFRAIASRDSLIRDALRRKEVEQERFYDFLTGNS